MEQRAFERVQTRRNLLGCWCVYSIAVHNRLYTIVTCRPLITVYRRLVCNYRLVTTRGPTAPITRFGCKRRVAYVTLFAIDFVGNLDCPGALDAELGSHFVIVRSRRCR